MRSQTDRFVRWLNDIRSADVSIVGGKALRLGRLIAEGVSCPAGFCVTTEAFDLYLRAAGLRETLLSILQDASMASSQSAAQIRDIVEKTGIPEEVEAAIIEAYHQLERPYKYELPVAVRSSAQTEDAETSSFAGQFDSFLGIVGEKDLVKSVRDCWNSLFTARSIAYSRRQRGKNLPLAMAAVVQELVQADKAGVMFTVHPVTSEKKHIVIEATFGLGEQLLSGQISPDTYVLSRDGFTIVDRIIGKKESAIFYVDGEGMVEREVDPVLQQVAVLGDAELVQLGRLGTEIEALFDTPQDIEWAIKNGSVNIVQARPMTTM